MPVSPPANRGSPTPARPNPRFIAGLMAAAALLLGLGASFRPKTEQPTTAVPSNELATLPGLSQRRSLRDMADFITERAGASAAAIIYLPEYNSSALAVGPDSAVTAIVPPGGTESSAEPVRFLRVRRPATDSASGVPLRAGLDTLRSRWVLLVARAPGGQILSLAGLVGGHVETRCGDLKLRELVFDTAVPLAFRGGGLFNLDGNVVGMAVPCGERIMLVPSGDVARALERQETTEYRVWADLGFRTLRPNSLSDSIPAIGEGLLVTEVLLPAPAGRAGLRAGDRIVRVGAEAIQRIEDVAPLLSVAEPRRLILRRLIRGVALRAVADSSVNLFATPAAPPSGARLAEVPPGSAADRAGLRPGDVILRLGARQQPSEALVRRALADTSRVLLVYQRGDRQRAIFLP